MELFALPEELEQEREVFTQKMHETYVTDMANELQPLQPEFDILQARRQAHGQSALRDEFWNWNGERSLPASPTTRARMPKSHWSLMLDVPVRMRRPLAKQEIAQAYRGLHPNSDSHREFRAGQEAGRDYWIYVPSKFELWRVHLQSRRCMFDPLRNVLEDHPQDQTMLPMAITLENVQGVRATQVRNDVINHEDYVRPQAEFFLDNIRWRSWNTQLDLGVPWKGITRFFIRQTFEFYPVLHTWLEGRHAAETLWRMSRKVLEAYHCMREQSGWPDESSMKEQAVREGLDAMDFISAQQRDKEGLLDVQDQVAEIFAAFAAATFVNPPAPHSEWEGLQELLDDTTGTTTDLVDVTRPETGKVRLELQWNSLSDLWQQAFKQPILDALKIYFDHDALAPVMPDDPIDEIEILPSRFVLVNKSDPRNTQPLDEDLENAKLKARLVVAGHKDQRPVNSQLKHQRPLC